MGTTCNFEARYLFERRKQSNGNGVFDIKGEVKCFLVAYFLERGRTAWILKRTICLLRKWLSKELIQIISNHHITSPTWWRFIIGKMQSITPIYTVYSGYLFPPLTALWGVKQLGYHPKGTIIFPMISGIFWVGKTLAWRVSIRQLLLTD